jgi:hypothetical protein
MTATATSRAVADMSRARLQEKPRCAISPIFCYAVTRNEAGGRSKGCSLAE